MAWEMFFLVKGSVQLVVNVGDAAEEVCATMIEGSYFGELALLMGVHRSTSARVVEHSNMFVLSKEGIQQTVLTYPNVVKQLEAALRRNMTTVAGLKDFLDAYMLKVHWAVLL